MTTCLLFKVPEQNLDEAAKKDRMVIEWQAGFPAVRWRFMAEQKVMKVIVNLIHLRRILRETFFEPNEGAIMCDWSWVGHAPQVYDTPKQCATAITTLMLQNVRHVGTTNLVDCSRQARLPECFGMIMAAPVEGVFGSETVLIPMCYDYKFPSSIFHVILLRKVCWTCGKPCSTLCPECKKAVYCLGNEKCKPIHVCVMPSCRIEDLDRIEQGVVFF